MESLVFYMLNSLTDFQIFNIVSSFSVLEFGFLLQYIYICKVTECFW